MKKQYFIMMLLASGAFAQNINIPDQNFKNRLVSGESASFTGNGNSESGPVDTNGDGEIQLTEAQAVIGLHVDTSWHNADGDIASLEGLQYFTNLKFLDCRGNALQSLDVSGLSQLQTLRADYNQLANINLQGAVALESLSVYQNQLTALNLAELSQLTYLSAAQNLLTSINVSGTSDLEFLEASYNPLEAIDLSGLTALEYLDLTETNVSEIDASMTPLIQLRAENCPQLVSVNVRNGVVTEADPDLLFFPFQFFGSEALESVCIDEGELSSFLSTENPANMQLFGGENCDVPISLGLSEFKSSALTLYPVPAQTQIQINCNVTPDAILVADLSGKQFSLPMHSADEISLDITGLDQGMYIITVIAADGSSRSGRFLKE